MQNGADEEVDVCQTDELEEKSFGDEGDYVVFGGWDGVVLEVKRGDILGGVVYEKFVNVFFLKLLGNTLCHKTFSDWNGCHFFSLNFIVMLFFKIKNEKFN